MAYVAGFIARHSGESQPSARAEDEPVEALWTRLRSVGGLTIPTCAFFKKFLEMNREFYEHHARHADQLSREPGVIRRLAQALVKKHPRLPIKVVRRFTRTRTFIRMRSLNRKARKEAAEKREKRKRKSFTN